MGSKNRILLKISGEALMGKTEFGLDVKTVKHIANEIKEIYRENFQICLIIGGGNIFRGIQGASEGIDRSTSDYMGMLATVMNALSMQSALENVDVPTRVQSAISMSQVAEPYIRRKAIRHLEKAIKLINELLNNENFDKYKVIDLRIKNKIITQ